MSDDFEKEKMEIPEFQKGGRVRETGLAVVHEGESILPAPDSEADIEPAKIGSQSVINYYFPVEIVIVGSLPEEEREIIENRIFEKISDAINDMT